MERWQGKTAIVTGAASDIGAAITRALLSKKINVVGLDMQGKLFKKKEGETSQNKDHGKFYQVQCDLSQYVEIKNALMFVDETLGGADILVNNSGIANYTKVFEKERPTFEKLVNLKVLLMATCINKCTRSMKDRKVEGHIFNINSLVSHVMPPEVIKEKGWKSGWKLYPACKQDVISITKCIREEIQAVNAPIKITGISPGIVRREICQKFKNLEDYFEKSPHIGPEDIAEALVFALSGSPELQISEITVVRTNKEK